MKHMCAENDGRLFFCQQGYYKGKLVTVTHRNPESGDVWLEDYPVTDPDSGYKTCGKWVRGDAVKYKES